MALSKEKMISLYQTMVRIRTFEETSKELFLGGKLCGFLHLYSGEEAVAAGVCAHLTDSDYITSTHRGHGHIIAKGGSIDKMMAELYGRTTGYCKGKGGSMHIADIEKGIVGANGIVAAGLPIAVGVGFTIKYLKKDSVVVSFFGDGATNRGTFHEAVNMAAALDLPVIFVCENNNFGMSTPQSEYMRVVNIAEERCGAYGIPGFTVKNGNDVVAVYETMKKALKLVKEGKGPVIMECKTWRHYGHFIGDPAPYQKPEDKEYWLKNDPIPNFRKRLIDEKVCNEEELKAIEDAAVEELAHAIEFAESSPFPSDEELFADLYA